MSWQLRHEGSPQVLKGLSLAQVAEGLRDGKWEPTDEVQGPGDKGWQAIENHPQLAEIAEELEAPPQRRHEDATSLDMNALIDVCLVLLIFFILTTSYVNLVQKVVPLPATKADGGARRVSVADVKNRMIRVHAYLDSGGKPVVRVENQAASVVEGDHIDPEKMHDALLPYLRGENRKTEMILDAQGITWDDVIRIQDGARAAGIQTVHRLMKR